jgi:hypothetical protein
MDLKVAVYIVAKDETILYGLLDFCNSIRLKVNKEKFLRNRFKN